MDPGGQSFTSWDESCEGPRKGALIRLTFLETWPWLQHGRWEERGPRCAREDPGELQWSRRERAGAPLG